MVRRFVLWIWPVVPVLAALLLTSLLLVLFGAQPLEAFQSKLEGAFGDQSKTLSVLAFWVPLLLCATGLLITFTAGLWNIGIEGQIILGAIAASWVALRLQAPGPVLIILEILAAMAAGALWAALWVKFENFKHANNAFDVTLTGDWPVDPPIGVGP